MGKRAKAHSLIGRITPRLVMQAFRSVKRNRGAVVLRSRLRQGLLYRMIRGDTGLMLVQSHGLTGADMKRISGVIHCGRQTGTPAGHRLSKRMLNKRRRQVDAALHQTFASV